MSDAGLHIVTRLSDGRQGGSVTVFVGIAPGDEAMFGKNDQLRVRFGAYCQSDLARQPKAWAAVRNPDQVLAEAVPRQCLATGGAGEVVRRVGMGMIDMGEWQEPMQESLDGGTRPARLIEAVGEVVDHLAVAHAFAFQQGEHIVQVQAGKRVLSDGRQV